MTSHAGCFFLVWSCCYALGILLTRYLLETEQVTVVTSVDRVMNG